MTHDEALALYNAGPKVVAKILCDLSNTIESQQEQIKALEVKVAKLSKNSSNSSK
ncbi:MAG: IS66 family transposase, partial [candidate division Zixibacteria bacterium]|nr:IS66 family transposase [candidate division Zixibacteria bacterium]